MSKTYVTPLMTEEKLLRPGFMLQIIEDTAGEEDQLGKERDNDFSDGEGPWENGGKLW